MEGSTPSRASATSARAPATLSNTLSPAVAPGTGAGAGAVSADASASATVSPPRPECGAPAVVPPPPHGDEAVHPTADANGDDAKRPRACEACRGLKVRCEMAEEGPCRRCRKAGRRCIVTVRSRGGERQKKTDTRVAELEKKIDILAATLHARGGSEHAAGASAGQTPDAVPLPEASRAPNPMMKSLLTHWGVTDASASPGQQPTAGQKRKLSTTQDPRADDGASRPPNLRGSPPGDPGDGHSDIVERGLITAEHSETLLTRYNEVMVPHLPAVVFPPGTTVASLRESKPLLFHAVMAGAASDAPALQKTLVSELMREVADRVVCRGEKSLELVQTLLVSVAWYWPPESFDELKFYQLVHMGIVMAIDLGLGRVGGTGRPRHLLPAWGSSNSRLARLDAESIECRRTWLGAYLFATNVAIGLRRTNLLPWTTFMQESVHVLETSDDAAPTDAYLCQLVRVNRLGEKATTQFSLDDPVMSVNLADVRTQLILKSLERELEGLKRDVPKSLLQPTLLIGLAAIDIYMHEMSLHSDDFDDMKGSFTTTRLDDGLANMKAPTGAHIDAVIAAYSAATSTFETFMSMEMASLRTLPLFNLVRVAYAMVVLIKIYFTAAAPDSELGKVLPKEAVRVDYYLDSMVSKFMAAAAEDKCRPAGKFMVVLIMLRGWLNKKTGTDRDKKAPGNPDTEKASAPSPEARSGGRGDSTPARARGAQERHGSRDSVAPPPCGATQQPQGFVPYPVTTANTPLQLLSEVATGDSNMGGARPIWQTTPGGGPPFFMPGGAAGLGPMDVAATVAPQWTEAASGMGYLLGDTFDWEGMAMSFGVGMSSEQEYEIMSMMTEANRPWGGGSVGDMPPAQGAYYAQ